MTDGIHIPRELADAEGVPEDLDASRVGPYRFPDPRRRRIAGLIYGVAAIGVALMGAGRTGAWVAMALLTCLAVWHGLSSWPLRYQQAEALARSASLVPFPIGHASAAVTFTGIRARPRWHIVVYSADLPPSRRALVQLDGVTGEPVADTYIESLDGA